MDAERLLRLLSAGDRAVWPDLSRDLERRGDAPTAAQALRLLRRQGHVVEAAQWLARVADAPHLQGLREALRASAQRWRVSRLRALTRDLLSGTYRLIPAGSFLMGSPPTASRYPRAETQHLVEITLPFLLKTTPVTQGEWQAVMGDNPAHFSYRPYVMAAEPRRPVEQVSWEDAVRFCDTLSARAGGTYRLPTEAEWEYACRAGTTTARYGDLHAIAWYEKNANGMTQPVGQKQPNAWGLYDMLGNVHEWCQDWYGDYLSEPQRDPQGPPHGDQRVVRGGTWGLYSFDFDDPYLRAASRGRHAPSDRTHYIGLRTVHCLAWRRLGAGRGPQADASQAEDMLNLSTL